MHLEEITEDELFWDLRALEVVEDAGWLPSLHLNLADDYRRLARTQEAETSVRSRPTPARSPAPHLLHQK